MIIAGLEGVQKIENDDFTPLIQNRNRTSDVHMESDEQLVTGFHHKYSLSLLKKLLMQ